MTITDYWRASVSRVKRARAVLNLLLLFAGCALSPQIVTIHPGLNLSAKDIGRGRTIVVEVFDQRSSPTIGTRGGIYSKTSLISPSGDITIPVRNALVAALNNYRFIVALPGTSSPLNMTVTIEDLRYTPLGGIPGNIRTEVALRVLCRDGSRQYTSRFTAKTTTQILTPPSAEDNERMINAILSKGLERMMNDPGLLNFLMGQSSG